MMLMSESDLIWGVTFDSTKYDRNQRKFLAASSRKLTPRIVCDKDVPVETYLPYSEGLAPMCNGQVILPVDSSWMKDLTDQQVTDRFTSYCHGFAGRKDVIIEVSNEANGSSWTGDPVRNAKWAVLAADIAHSVGLRTMITLNLVPDDAPDGDTGILTFAKLFGLQSHALFDIVAVDRYEEDTSWEEPDWLATFAALALIFPDSKLAVGECGCNAESGKSAALMAYYYRTLNRQMLDSALGPRWIGGFFWWYGVQQFIVDSWGVKKFASAIAPPLIGG